MLRWMGIVSLLLLMAGVGYLALREKPLPRADFTYSIGDELKTLDPARMAWNEDIRMALGLWEGLTSYHPRTSEAVEGTAYLPPALSADRLTYTFTIRPEARWSNGDPVEAEDFVYAWRRAMEPGTARDYAFFMTDNIAVAAEYAAWRNEAVRVLALLRDLEKGNHAMTLSQEEQALFDKNNIDLKFKISDVKDENLNLKSEIFAQTSAFRRDHLARQNAEFAKVGMRALGPRRLQVTLVRPTAYFLDLAAFSTFLPLHRRSLDLLRVRDNPEITELTLWDYDPQWVKPDYHKNGYPGLLTNGPFRLKEWQFKRFILLEKNPEYWDQANVRSRTIMARIILEPSTSFLAYEQGEVNWLDDVTRLDFAPTLVEKMRSGLRPDIHLQAAFGTYFYIFNCLPTLPDGRPNPLADPRVRMALNLAVDKQALAEQVRKTGNPPAWNFIPPGSIPGYNCPLGPRYDPEKARRLLAEAGHPAGRGLPAIEILYNTGYDHDKPAQAIAEMWQRNLGVAVTLAGLELKSFDDRKKAHQFVVCRGSWYGDYMDPTTFLDMLTTGNGNNDAAFSSPEYDGLMKQAADERDPERRLRILAQAESLLNDTQVPNMPLYYYVNLLAFRPEVKGLYPNARNMYPFKYIWVEK